MSDISDPVWFVIARFPEQCESIIYFLGQSSEFRALCSDYAEAVEASHCWRVSDTPEAQTLAKGYESVVVKLEAEIWRRLQSHAEVSG